MSRRGSSVPLLRGLSVAILLTSAIGQEPDIRNISSVENEDFEDVDTAEKRGSSGGRSSAGIVLSSTASQEDGWTDWGIWDGCTRTCDGGVTKKLRKCIRKTGCSGPSVKYRICNMQPCPEIDDFRATQCTAYNNIAYRGRLYEWLPFYDPEDPCSLTCQALTFNFVAKLAPKVKDGTRCRDGALDMCVSGTCMPVGCDLQLGSTLKIDDCGVCGGDGSSCRQPLYSWGEAKFSPCSVTCGGGYQMSRPVCMDKNTEKEVDERLCDVSTRAQPEVRECNTFKCPATWVTEPWGPCTQTCGGGRQLRLVYCSQAGPNATRVKVSDHHCPRQRPPKERSCGTGDCPIWFEGPWSPCSATCGTGFQTRTVVCRDTRGLTSEECNPTAMPLTRQACTTGISCPQELKAAADLLRGSQEDAPPNMYALLPWTQKLNSPAPVSTEPTFVIGDWGFCSVTCGEGIRKRQVDCKIFLEFSKTVAKLPDKECPGIKPPEIERCFPRPCSLGQNKELNAIPSIGIEVTYSWKTAGFTPCTASCLGGIRESIIQCVRDHDQAVISPYLCDIGAKPDAITQTCMDIPCPPRWNMSDFSVCSKPCGGGMKTREVQCIHEVTRGSFNTLVVSNAKCPQPPPRSEQLCNMFPCPTRWRTEPWSKCSKSCGGGIKVRKIRCQKEHALGQVVDQPPSRCPRKRPKIKKPCNSKPCPQETLMSTSYYSTYDEPSSGIHQPQSQIYASHGTYDQLKPQKTVSLKVGGKAVFFKGTNVKIRCPSRNKNKTQIMWFKNGKPIESSKKYRITNKGTLRIRKISYANSGVYSCAVGKSRADLTIGVKQLSPGYVGSDEDRTVERPKGKGANNPALKTEEQDLDYSHERHQVLINKDPPAVPTKGKDHNRSHFAYAKVRPYNQDNGARTGHKTRLQPPDQTSDEKFGNRIREPLKIKQLAPLKARDWDEPMVKIWEPSLSANESPEPTQDETWENKHTDPPFSDQDSGEDYVKSPPPIKDTMYPNLSHGGEEQQEEAEAPARSGASSQHPLPHIQQLLVNLHTSLQGSGKGSENEDEPHQHAMASTLSAHSTILGKGSAENLEFDWVTTEWSSCTQKCGGKGYQVRTAQCLVRLNNVSKPVDKTLCQDAGLKPPLTVQKCGFLVCPTWETGSWSACLENNCFTWHMAYQERTVYCQLNNGSMVDPTFCGYDSRPLDRQECYNERCRGSWTVGEWSQCTKSCGDDGFQTRILQCIWPGTRKAAGNACRDENRPSVFRHCKGPPCSLDSECADRSTYCGIAKDYNMCRMPYYLQHCCRSCRNT